jgi:eukaryotic-like serine/threonine-protein kinase
VDTPATIRPMSQSDDRQDRVRAVLDETLMHDPSEREAYLDQTCDPQLRTEVLRLLGAYQDSHSFPERTPELTQTVGPPDFPGTERFRVARQLGSGGMGIVYEVHDCVRDEVVALKTLRRTGAADFYRLKREFRSLADVSHPNLACLYELFVEEDWCFFTMELVKGVSFVEYARGPDRAQRSDGRVVHALRQLVEGVSALHRRGKLHRDIKPSNVLVTTDGRVVLLDFGLTAELVASHSGQMSYVRGGTPAYMSPEEVSGVPPSEASDWYGVGITLYEALTGTIPFAGPIRDVLQQKRTSDPPEPADLAPDVPASLSAICSGLLCRDPKERLTGADVLRELAREAGHVVPDSGPALIRDIPFVGRDSELRVLNGALKKVTDGSAAAIAVYGPSGIGKSALVRCFLNRVRERGSTVMLAGRCYVNESVPYKAVDGMIDDLSRYLGSIPRRDVESLLPRDVSALTRVFPVLLQVGAIAHVRSEPEPGTADLLDVRRRAFDALRDLISRLAARRTLVICIDDLQWADADSAVLLEGLLRPPNPPGMLTLLCFRSEETAAKPFLQALLERAGRDIWSAISLEPMTDAEAQALIGSLVPAGSGLTDHDRRRMASEAGGSPFVLEQLARYAGVSPLEPGQEPTFARMFDTRLAALSPDARSFLETLAVCGRPMAAELICDACGVARDKQTLVTTLRSSLLIRSSGSSERIETYHDRIREVLAGRIAADAVRQIHARMVSALVRTRSDDCEALFEHHRGAGDPENASVQAVLAAEKASAALAFDRAATFYRHALALAPSSPGANAWKEGLADAVANTGRPAEAAEAYLDAAVNARYPHRVELQRRAAEQFLTGGHIDRGLELIRTVLDGIGVRVPRSPRAALLSLLWRRARLRWRGLDFVSRPVEEVDADALLRIDTCWSATSGLAMVDMISASAFSARHLLMALDVGEPYRIARAMAIEATARSAVPTGRQLGEKLVRQSTALAESVGHPHALALSTLAQGINATMQGEWKKALTLSEQALAILRDQCAGLTWELTIAQNLVIWALMYLGELGEVSRQVPTLLANARSRGNLYLATELCTRANYVWLVKDDPDEGERETVESIARWSHRGFHRQHYSAMLARVQTALYRGDGGAAWQLLAEQEAGLRGSYLRRVQVIRIEWFYLRARSALAMAHDHQRSPRLLSVARVTARRIVNERMSWSDPLALLVRAGIASLEGRSPLALKCLHDAADRFDRADMKLYAAVARHRIGALQDDAAGREFQRQAREWFAAQRIRNPAAFARMLAPGFPDAS